MLIKLILFILLAYFAIRLLLWIVALPLRSSTSSSSGQVFEDQEESDYRGFQRHQERDITHRVKIVEEKKPSDN